MTLATLSTRSPELLISLNYQTSLLACSMYEKRPPANLLLFASCRSHSRPALHTFWHTSKKIKNKKKTEKSTTKGPRQLSRGSIFRELAFDARHTFNPVARRYNSRVKSPGPQQVGALCLYLFGKKVPFSPGGDYK